MDYETLYDHLLLVATLAEGFAAGFGAGHAAYWLGWWHDIGKAHPDFQTYLTQCVDDPDPHRRGPDHKAAGALLAEHHPTLSILSLLIHGHHGGLPALSAHRTQWLPAHRAQQAPADAIAIAERLLPLAAPPTCILPAFAETLSLTMELFLRMLFSALVDADALATERHWAQDHAQRRGGAVPIATLWQRFLLNQERLVAAEPPSEGHRAKLHTIRSLLYDACIAAAAGPRGLYRLAMPVGTGKTRSAMGFALAHAMTHALERIIVVVPFLSITEQTAGVYRAIFETDGLPVVLEHHSAVEHDETPEGDERGLWQKLGSENWDAPIIVTTVVQLFESLFAARTSRCRKLHNVANSVIVIDEVQSLPLRFLQPILDALSQLTTFYGTTVVLSTATQPTFSLIPGFAELRAHDIIPEPQKWLTELRRVRYEFRLDHKMEWLEVVQLMQESQQTLTVVNTRRQARALTDELLTHTPRPPGHHADVAALGGCCYLNNAAIAAQILTRCGTCRDHRRRRSPREWHRRALLRPGRRVLRVDPRRSRDRRSPAVPRLRGRARHRRRPGVTSPCRWPEQRRRRAPAAAVAQARLVRRAVSRHGPGRLPRPRRRQGRPREPAHR